MLNRKSKAVATAPLSVDQVKDDHKSKIEGIDQSILSKTDQAAEIKIHLPKMSKELYGTEHYTMKGSWWKPVVTVIILLLVGGFEIPLNSAGFEMLGRPQTTTTLMAVGFGLLLAALAEGAGYCLKRGHAQKSRALTTGGIACVLIACGLAYWVATFRMAYFHRMHYSRVDLSLNGQFIFAMCVFLIGVGIIAMLTSGVKNLKLERVFKSKISEAKKIEKQTEKLRKERELLKKQLPTLIAQARNYEADQAYQTQKANNLATETVLQKQKNEEALIAQRKEEAKTSFNLAFNQVNAESDKAHKVSKTTTDKDDLRINPVYSEAVATITQLIKQMEELAPDVEDSDRRITLAKQLLTNLNNLVTL